MINEDLDYTNPRILRLLAEKKLTEKNFSPDDPEDEADTKRLLHELQVHKIELEMQIEELRYAYETSEEALKKYTMLYDFAPIAYFTLDPDGRICDLNFTGAEILGEKRFTMVNTIFRIFVSPESKPVFDNFFKQVSSSTSKVSCEVSLACANKQLDHVYIEGIATGDDQKILLSVLDITNFKKQFAT